MESSAARAGGGQALSQPDQDRQRALADKMQTVAMELQGIEGELQAAVEVRQRLDSQLTENEQVKKVCRQAGRPAGRQKEALKRIREGDGAR